MIFLILQSLLVGFETVRAFSLGLRMFGLAIFWIHVVMALVMLVNDGSLDWLVASLLLLNFCTISLMRSTVKKWVSAGGDLKNLIASRSKSL
jgi:hypothetical protein